MTDDNPNPEENPTDEPEQFDADKARDKIRKVNSEAAALRKRLTEAEERGKDTDEIKKKLPALEAENLRLRIAVKHGLPESLVKRLSGTTEEEILQDAEELMEMFGGPKKPPTQQPREQLRGGGDPTKPADVDIPGMVERVFTN
jgi:hypothetical protein